MPLNGYWYSYRNRPRNPIRRKVLIRARGGELEIEVQIGIYFAADTLENRNRSET